MQRERERGDSKRRKTTENESKGEKVLEGTGVAFVQQRQPLY